MDRYEGKKGRAAIEDKLKAQKKQQDILEAEQKEYSDAINRIFASDDGKFFLNKMKRACAVNSFDKEINPAKFVEDNGRKKVWYELIYPYIDKEILRELEQ